MILHGPRTVGVLAVLASLPTLYLVRELWDIRYNISVMWFILTLAVFGLWVFTTGAALLVPNNRITAGLLYFARIAGIAATLSIFLFVLEYTTGRTVGVRTVAPFLVVPIVTVGALLVRPESFMTVQFDNGPYTLVFGQFGLVQVGYSLLLQVMNLTLLFRGYLVTSGKHRKQVMSIFGGYFVAVLSVFLPVVSPVPDYANPGVFGLLALLVAAGYSLKRFDLFTIGPLERRYVVDEIDDAVVMWNTERSVIDFNEVARERFGLAPRDIGHAATTVFSAYPALQELIEGEETTQTITRQTAGGEKHFAATATPFDRGRGPSGTILVLRNITPMKDREEELDMLRQVFLRVFRHNIRNELNVISGHLQSVQSQLDDDQLEQIRPASEAINRILNHSEKARQTGQLLGRSSETRSVSLQKLVSHTVSSRAEQYPDATITCDVDDVPVRVITGFENAIGGAVENSVEHNADSVVVELSSEVEDDTVTLIIEDNGTGIPDAEVNALTAERETALSHTSGVGLWLMKWAVEKSNGEFGIARTATGTRVEMRLERG